MTTIRWSALFLLAAACGGAPEAEEPAPAPAPATAPAPEGEQAAADADDIDVVVKPVYHATVVLQIGDSVWWVDPWSKGPIADFPKADVTGAGPRERRGLPREGPRQRLPPRRR